MSSPSGSFSDTQTTSPSSEATPTSAATASNANSTPSTSTVSNKGNGFNTMTIAVPLGMALALLMGGIAFYLHRKQRKRRARRWHGAGLSGGSNYAQMREDASLVSLPASSLNLRLFGPDGWLGRFKAARQQRQQQQQQQQQQPVLPVSHSPVTRPEASRANPFIAGGFTFGEGAAGVMNGLGRRPSMATSYQASEFIRHSSHAPSEADHSFIVHTHHTGASSTYPSVSAHHTGSSFQSHNAPRIIPYPYPHPLRMQHTGSTKVGSDLQSVTMRDSADGHGVKEDDNSERGKMKDPFGDDASLGGTSDTDSYSSHASWSTAGRESRR